MAWDLWGIPGLGHADRQKLHAGNMLFLFTLRVMQCCERHQVPHALENPCSSMAWELPSLCRFRQQYGAKMVHLDFCQYGEA